MLHMPDVSPVSMLTCRRVSRHMLTFICCNAVSLPMQVKLGERYGHVVRMRTDTVWTRDWMSTSPAAAASTQGTTRTASSTSSTSTLPVPPGSLAGPRYHARGVLLDHFFICSRAVAWAALYEAPILFQRSWDRDAVHLATGCDAVLPGEEAHTDCHKAIYGLNSVWPEAILTMFFRQNLGTHMVDSCDLTGEFVVNSRNSPTLRPCEGSVAMMSREDDDAVAEVEKYFEVEMWLPD